MSSHQITTTTPHCDRCGAATRSGFVARGEDESLRLYCPECMDRMEILYRGNYEAELARFTVTSDERGGGR